MRIGLAFHPLAGSASLAEGIEVTMGLLSIFTFKKANLHQQGRDAVDRGDLHEAFELYSQLAHNGDPEGQCRLAHLYKSGVQDFDKAALWYTRAAAQGHAEAQCKLGFLCRSGKGVPQSDSQGAHWYQEAAVQGYTEAQYNLARCLRLGEGIQKDIQAAISWHTRAAKAGFRPAAYELGTLYLFGEEVPQDAAKAICWLEKASLDAAADPITVGELVDSTGESHNVSVLALFNLGQIYEQGKIVQSDPVKAFRYMLKAAELRHPTAQCNVGFMLCKGIGTTRNLDEGLKWLVASAQQGNTQAQIYLQNLPELRDLITFECSTCGATFGGKEEHVCR